MGGFPFLVLLAIYATVFIWYALEAERGGRGEGGLLGMRRGDEPGEEDDTGALTPRERIKRMSRREP